MSIPKEFEWIKPGVKCKVNFAIPFEAEIITDAYFKQKNIVILSSGEWMADVFNGKEIFSVYCYYIEELNSITLTLTREQAESIADILADVLHYGPSAELEELKKQIEEKLK